MLSVNVENSRIRFGDRFSLLFLRTLRVPEDGGAYPLPPGLGEFPVHRVEEFAGNPNVDWGDRTGAFIPMYQREAMWLGFEGAAWKPNVVKVGVGGIDAITGGDWNETLHSDPQDYLVCPPQPWLDGFNTGSGVVRQFVAAPVGLGLTVESQLSASEIGGLRFLVFEPRRGRFPDSPPPRKLPTTFQTEKVSADTMGLAAGGEIEQKIYTDPYGLDFWDQENFGAVSVHILNSKQYRLLTGLESPPTAIDAGAYTRYGFPWFEIYDEEFVGLAAAEKLTTVKSLRQKESEHHGATASLDEPVEVPKSQVRSVKPFDQTPSSEE